MCLMNTAMSFFCRLARPSPHATLHIHHLCLFPPMSSLRYSRDYVFVHRAFPLDFRVVACLYNFFFRQHHPPARSAWVLKALARRLTSAVRKTAAPADRVRAPTPTVSSTPFARLPQRSALEQRPPLPPARCPPVRIEGELLRNGRPPEKTPLYYILSKSLPFSRCFSRGSCTDRLMQ